MYIYVYMLITYCPALLNHLSDISTVKTMLFFTDDPWVGPPGVLRGLIDSRLSALGLTKEVAARDLPAIRRWCPFWFDPRNQAIFGGFLE